MILPSGPGSSDPDPARDEFDDERPEAPAAPPAVPSPSRLGSRRTILFATVAVLLAAAVGAAMAWRAQQRRSVVAQGLSRAEVLLRSDTFAGYGGAERLLEPLSQLDPVAPAAMRGFALAMLALDYRDEEAARRAEALLVEPGRAPEAPRWVPLGYGALALSRHEAGTAMSYAARAADGAWPAVLQARVALLAGKPEVALEALDRAAAVDPGAPAVQALRGDALRRTGRPAEAREAYAAALTASPLHPRAAFGLAKLALAGSAVAPEAREALLRLLDDQSLPVNERARAAYHLATLEARAGRRFESVAAVDRAPVDPDARLWLGRVVSEQARASGYHVPASTPAALQSASDDDLYVPPPRAPISTAVSPTFRMPDPPPRPAAPAPRTAPASEAPRPVAASPKRSPARSSAKPKASKAANQASAAPRKAARPAPKKAVVKKALPKKKPVAAKSGARTKAVKPPPGPSEPTPTEGSALDRAMSKVR